MTRGKQAAMAANRRADAAEAKIAELLQQLAADRADRDAARRELKEARRELDNRASEIAADMASSAMIEMRDERDAALAALQAEPERLGRLAFRSLKGQPISLEGWQELANVFGFGNRIDVIAEEELGKSLGNRYERRLTRNQGKFGNAASIPEWIVGVGEGRR